MLFIISLVSILILVAGTVIYPDTYASAGIDIGQFRMSPLGALFILTAPVIAFYVWRHRDEIRFRTVDAFLWAMVTYFTVRGLVGASGANTMALCMALAGYTLVLYYGMAVLGQEQLMARAFLITVATLAIIVAGYAIIEFYVRDNFLFKGVIKDIYDPYNRDYFEYYRVRSTLGHPTALGLFLVQTVPFLLYFFARSSTVLKKAAWAVALAAVALAMEMTLTKGSWLTAAVLISLAILWILVYKPSSLKTVSILMAFITTVLLIFTLTNVKIVNEGVFSERRSVYSFDIRKYMWERTPEVVASHPLFGVGLWQGAEVVGNVEPVEIDQSKLTTIDNTYLTTMVEEGIVGLLLLGGTLALIGRQAWLLLRKGGQTAMLSLPLICGMCAVLINGMTVNSLLIWPALVIFWASAGLIRAKTEAELEGSGNTA